MLNSAIMLLKQKWTILFLSFLFIVGLSSQKAISQPVTPSFKIVGKTQGVFTMGIMFQSQLRAVEYDSLSPDHLFISDLGDSNRVLIKTRYLFKGNRFSLPMMNTYIGQQKLIPNSRQCFYKETQTLESEQVFKEGVLQRNTFFYDNGIKRMTYCEDKEQLNGEFIMWHPNGQISFTGHYKNDLKDGQFESFYTSGKSERKGTYREGKLIEGQSVVQDQYDLPELPPRYKDNDSILNEVVAMKSANIEALKKMKGGIIKNLDLTFTIDKTGHINKVDIDGQADAVDKEIIHSVFNNEFEGFEPATIKGAPVSGYFQKSFFISDKGLEVNFPHYVAKNDSTLSGVMYDNVEEMPEFPGGHSGLMEYISQTVRYPKAAMQKSLQGKVFVSFVILEDGQLANIMVSKGVHPLLDAESVRVVQQMPKWNPGRHDGKAVKVKYMVPINFMLKVFKEEESTMEID